MKFSKEDHRKTKIRSFLAFMLFVCFSEFFSLYCSADTVTYQYDASSRLTRVEYSNGITIQYTYDAAGNMVTKKVSLMSECPECTASPVDLTNVTFEPGRTCACSDNTSITLGSGVSVEDGANITFKAPKINLKPGFKAKSGSVVKMQQQ